MGKKLSNALKWFSFYSKNEKEEQTIWKRKKLKRTKSQPKQKGELNVDKITPLKLNSIKLSKDEKVINVIWIGELKTNELNNLKVWTKINPEYKIIIWTDFDHSLSPKLKKLIIEKSTRYHSGENYPNIVLETELQSEFYNEYQLKNTYKTFNDNATQFIIDKGWMTRKEISDWINNAKSSIKNANKLLKRCTNQEVIVQDISLINHETFDNKEYYDGYLLWLEFFMIPAAASDYLRYQIIYKYGGVYLDIDLFPKLDYEKMLSDENELMLILQRYNKVHESKFNFQHILINELVSLKYNDQLNDESVFKLCESLGKKFNQELSFGDFNEMADLIDNIELDNYFNKIDDFNVDQIFKLKYFSNAFLIACKNSVILKRIKEQISKYKKENIMTNLFDFNIKSRADRDKIILATGPTMLCVTEMLCIDEEKFPINYKTYNGKLNQDTNMCSLNTINSLSSSWAPDNVSKFLNKYKINTNDANQIKEHYLNLTPSTN